MYLTLMAGAFAASSCASSATTAGITYSYVDGDDEWRADVITAILGGISVELKSTTSSEVLQVDLVATSGDPEMIEGPNGEAVPAQQYLTEGSCWASAAISDNKRYLRFEHSGCGIRLSSPALFTATEEK